MSQMLFHAHSGVRYLVLLTAAVALLVLLAAVAGRREEWKPARIAVAAFNGALDLQIVLGIALVALGRFHPAVLGHMMVMILAAVFAHGFAVASKKAPDARKRHGLALAGVTLAIVMIVGGIHAIGAPILGSKYDRAGAAADSAATLAP